MVTKAKKARQKLFHTFKVDWTTSDGERYLGSFTTKKLSVADTATIGVRKAQRNGGMYYDHDHPGSGVDFDTDNFNAMLAHCDVALVDVPEWWDLDTITDASLIGYVYEEVMKHENSFLGRGGKPTSEVSVSGGRGERSSESDLPSADAGGDAGAVVRGQVQDPLEP